MKNICEILIGIPGSGKSTYRKKQVSEKGASYTNMDEIRIELCKTSNLSKKEFESVVKKIKFQKLEELFKNDTPYVIVDDTNLSQKTISRAVTLAKQYNYEVKYTFMETSFNILKCHKNNMQRDHSEHVPVAVIENMAEMFYNTYFMINYGSTCKGATSAIMVDIDGTLAHMSSRSAFDWKRVGEDTIDTKVLELVNYYKSQGHKIIVCSGRDSICRPETEQWLKDNNVPYDLLLMRTENDCRPDSIVKLELYAKHIFPNFKIHVVLDDRNSVVTVWRGLGLKCLQVASGWF